MVIRYLGLWFGSVLIGTMLFSSCVNDGLQVGGVSKNDTTLAMDAVELFYEGKHIESLRILGYSIEEHPDVAELYFWKAKNMVALNNLSEGLKAYNMAIKYNPDMAKYYNNRGLLYMSYGEAEKAKSDFKEAIEKDGSLAAAYNNLGLVRSGEGSDEDAIKWYTKAIELNRSESFLYNRAVSFINLAEFQEAIQDFTDLIDQNPTNAPAFLYRGVAKFKLGQELEACEDFKRARELGSVDANQYLEHCNL